MTRDDAATNSLARQLRDMVVKRQEYTCEAVREKLDEWSEQAGICVPELVSIGNGNGKTALHFASQLRSDGTAELLLERRADVQRTTARGHTPLIYAAGRARNSVVRSLLEARASCRVRTANGDTALGMALGRCEADVVEALRQAEASEACAWDDFTQDEEAIAAQADHVEQHAHFACWQGDVPPPVADVLARRRRDRARSSASASAEQDAEVEELVQEISDCWCEERRLAAALLQRALGRRQRQAVPLFRRALLAAARGSGRDAADVGAARAIVLAHIVGEVLPEAARSLGGNVTAELNDLQGCDCHGGAESNPLPKTDAKAGPRGGRGPKESRRSKEARMIVTSSVLGALKELVPELAMGAAAFSAHAPPWMTIEVFSRPGAVDLVADEPALTSVLRQVCHEAAWGSDFGGALRWLRALRPAAGASAAASAAFERLAEALGAATLAAVEAGHSLRTHLRDNAGLAAEIRETLGPRLAGPILERCDAPARVLELRADPQALMPLAESVPFMRLPEGLPVTIVDSADSWAALEAQAASAKLLALDTEWWDAGRGPALVQVAVGDGDGGCSSCWLLDTLKAPSIFAPVLMQWIQQEDVEILGWSFGADKQRLQELFDLHGDGAAKPPDISVVDLQPHCCRLLGTPALVSLSTACAHLLGQSLDKAEQCSDWRRRPLSEDQATYAALDACALLALRGELLRRNVLIGSAAPCN